MKNLGFIRDAFGICAAAALLASCGTNISTVPQGNRDDAEAHSLTPVPFGRPAGSRHHERVLWSFTTNGKTGEGDPLSGLILDNSGALYGTFFLSADDGDGGGVFELTPSRSGYSKSAYCFCGTPSALGKNPAGGLIFDNQGALYGTDSYGGSYGRGTVFKLTPPVSEYSAVSVLHYFAGGSDGASPFAGLVFDDKGALYGTTVGGGYYGYGTVFKLTPSGSGYSESVLYSFSGGRDGANPYDGLILDKKDALYGTTSAGGYRGAGTVFKLTPSGSGYSESTLYRFQGRNDGANPYAGLIFDEKGALYGTTAGGGHKGFGTVFKLTPFGSSEYGETVLLRFGGRNGGAHPHAGLIFSKKGKLFGTTSSGGRYGFGTVFKLTPSGSGYSESVLHPFNYKDGASPQAGLTFGSTGVLYGTTSGGGDHGLSGFGTVFELTP
ncbi:MAG: choice-of-anchor tandem repeat GloVer-containing protein [Candidatus Cybelea sp.]